MKAWPIRWKFAGWTAALVGFALLVYSTFTLVNFYDEQIEAVDLDIEADGRRLTGLPSLTQLQATVTEHERYAPWRTHAVFDELGGLQYRSRQLSEAMAREALTQNHQYTARDGSSHWRIGTFTGHGGTLVVAYDLEEVRDTMLDLIIAYTLSLPVVVLIAAVGGWWVSGRALQPVRDLATTVEWVQAESLDHRVPVPPASDEIQRLSTVFNAMLSRLERSFEQAQRFAADASHELRTPLTIIRGEIDRLMRAPGITPDHQEKLVSVQEEIERLQHITDNLLLLARFDSGHVRFTAETLDLTSLVQDACDDAELLGASRNIRIERHLADGWFGRGDTAHVRRVVLNLLDNAVKFNFPDGLVRCSLSGDHNTVFVRVGNTGPGISAELRPHLFQRFFRADPSRSGAQQGHGLGLSLSREIARAHGGDLQLADSSEPGWTEFVFTLPSVPTAQAVHTP